ncbi:hypothetical protein [Aliarcobacter cryaerophilus]|jgi:hypothetical protein|uniref:hypothetical protein n=1 Tax=Aliarcobacter cryaerophilus TaxID=28198 RepID=UPI003DA5EA43
MNYKELNKIVDKLISSEKKVSDYKNENINILKAIGWQFALKYKHTTDKESNEAKKYLTILIEVRQLVKSKLNIEDKILFRYLK